MLSTIIIVAATLLATTVAGSGNFTVIPGTGLFRRSDDPNTVHLFHGVNIVHKAHGTRTITAHDLATIKTMGMNVIRFGIFWPNIEPSPGAPYNMTYLQAVKDSIELIYNETGAVSFLDMHQDCGSAYVGNGLTDGFPYWLGHPPNTSEFWSGGSKQFPLPSAVKPSIVPGSNLSGQPFAPWGKPDPALSQWAQCYTTFAAGAMWQRFYDNSDEFQDKFVAVWGAVAKFFKAHPAILMFEMINEPWLGNVPLSLSELDPVKNPKYWDLWVGGVADKKNLQPLYDRISAVVRQEDPERILGFEPAAGGAFLDGTIGYDHGPGGKQYDVAGKNVFANHQYCPLDQSDVPLPPGNKSDPQWNHLWKKLTVGFCDWLSNGLIQERTREIRKGGWGAFVTEFGALPSDHRAQRIVSTHLDQLDDVLTSWSYWEINDVEGMPQYLRNELQRSFPRATPGVITSFSTKNLTSSVIFSAEYVLSEGLSNSSRPTAEIYLSPATFPAGSNYTFSASPSCNCVKVVGQRDNETHVVTIQHDMSRLASGATVTIQFANAL